MNQRYEPIRPSTRVAAAFAAVLTVVMLFDGVASLADSKSGAGAGTVTASRPALPAQKA
jgi:hypothetical protein